MYPFNLGIDASVTVVGSNNSQYVGSHLRLNAGSLSQGVQVGTHDICQSICYYNYENDDGKTSLKQPLQQTVEADASGEKYDIMQMDDTLIPFSGKY